MSLVTPRTSSFCLMAPGPLWQNQQTLQGSTQLALAHMELEHHPCMHPILVDRSIWEVAIGALFSLSNVTKGIQCWIRSRPFIMYYLVLLFLLCFATPVLITTSLNVFIQSAVGNTTYEARHYWQPLLFLWTLVLLQVISHHQWLTLAACVLMWGPSLVERLLAKWDIVRPRPVVSVKDHLVLNQINMQDSVIVEYSGVFVPLGTHPQPAEECPPCCFCTADPWTHLAGKSTKFESQQARVSSTHRVAKKYSNLFDQLSPTIKSPYWHH